MLGAEWGSRDSVGSKTQCAQHSNPPASQIPTNCLEGSLAGLQEPWRRRTYAPEAGLLPGCVVLNLSNGEGNGASPTMKVPGCHYVEMRVVHTWTRDHHHSTSSEFSLAYCSQCDQEAVPSSPSGSWAKMYSDPLLTSVLPLLRSWEHCAFAQGGISSPPPSPRIGTSPSQPWAQQKWSYDLSWCDPPPRQECVC